MASNVGSGSGVDDRRAPWRIAILSPVDDADLGELVTGHQVEVVTPVRRNQESVDATCRDADIVVGDWTGKLHLSAAAAARWPGLCFVQHIGVGTDHAELTELAEALRGRDIPIANTPGTLAASIAEWCLGAGISLTRLIIRADRWVRDGGWPQMELIEEGARELASLRVGIVGMGAIGRHCARLFNAVGCDVSYWNRTPRDAEVAPARWRDLDTLVASSDLLIVAVAKTPATVELIDARRLSLMPAGALLINVSRGAIVSEEALIGRLASGQLAGAALDVFQTEPLPLTSPLRRFDTVILSPHSSENTPQARDRVLAAVRANLSRAVAGEPVSWVFNHAPPHVVRR